MGKSKKHGKPAKGVLKRGNKNDKCKRKAKFIDPASSVSRDVRESVEALVEEIEREELVVEPQPLIKAKKKRQELAEKESVLFKSGMTKEQAHTITNKLQQQGTTHRSEGEGDEESNDGDGGGTEEDYSDTANEPSREYRKGGYHHVVIGEVYNDRYRVVKKLGWGYFSTVWLVWDYLKERYQAMKIQKSAASYSEAAYDEIKLLTEIMEADPHKTRCCARLNDYFKHTGPNGTHVCMLFDVYGENLLSLMERYEYRGIPLPIVKCIARQVLIGLDHINSIDIIHTDLKPENVLLSTPKHSIISLMKHFHPPPLHQRPKLTERDPKTMTKSQRRRYYKKLAKEERKTPLCEKDGEHTSRGDERGTNENGDTDSELSKTDPEWEVERFHHVILADFGNSCWTYRQFTDEVQTRQYRCPEVILGESYSTSIDIWSCACMIFELITGQFLFDPKKGDDYSRDEDHLALMSELLGDLPESMRLGDGKYRSHYYNSKGVLRNIKDLQYWILEDVLHQRHKFTKKKAKEIADFLLPMLKYSPDTRATPAAMLRDHDAFFDIQEDDYAPLCFVDEGGDDEEGSASDDEEETDSDSSLDSYSSSYSSERKANRSRQLNNGADRSEAFRYWEEHPILNRTYLEERGLTIADVQSVLAGNFLDDAATHKAAAEVIRLLSEEADRLSSDRGSAGDEADNEDEDDSSDDDKESTQDSEKPVEVAVDGVACSNHGVEEGKADSTDKEDEESDDGTD
ncbi:serine/threonine-protein kinase, putative [Leishmania panamensis]|uniref:non-specific serine/threonine protein kinase n=2 Tax=Leishmania guyanensis species complex TaxID=38579 RepID=A0A088RXB0_LEIPA|nr:serine/threonine-protein kinase, putative [Leishmania panamensis]AIO00576.1 serine/threonine-protein kinase, putative [Leishmania panamensis]CCM17756.1 serine/threonine-protein kinase, putative,protein kinase, putative [Leishmania guyanensis]